ncbi:MAG: hypothetical protein ACAI35_07665 [Candidatus Methylacidiphilales bacterium]|nr:hypothetical protein [Candidatus Methylacidiphilales bacterium]
MPKTYATSPSGEPIEVEVHQPAASPNAGRGAVIPPPPPPYFSPHAATDSAELHAAKEGAFTGSKSFYHPYSGGAIMGVDLAAWGTVELPSGMMLAIVAIVGSFLLTFALVFNIQRNLNHDSVAAAAIKALIGAALAAVPFPIAGTAIGAMILLASGLPVSGAAGTVISLLTGKGRK